MYTSCSWRFSKEKRVLVKRNVIMRRLAHLTSGYALQKTNASFQDHFLTSRAAPKLKSIELQPDNLYQAFVKLKSDM